MMKAFRKRRATVPPSPAPTLLKRERIFLKAFLSRCGGSDEPEEVMGDQDIRLELPCARWAPRLRPGDAARTVAECAAMPLRAGTVTPQALTSAGDGQHDVGRSESEGLWAPDALEGR